LRLPPGLWRCQPWEGRDRRGVSPLFRLKIFNINAKTQKTMFFFETVHPVVFPNFVPRIMFNVSRDQALDLGESGAALGRIPCLMPQDEVANEIRPFENNAPAGGFRRGLAEIPKERRVIERIVSARIIVNGLARELNDGAGLKVTVRADV